MNLRDEETIQGLLNGDDQACATVREWVAIVVNAGRFGSALRPYREDIIQNTLLKVLTNLKADKFAGRSSLKTYIYEIAKNTCVDFMRAKYREKHVQDIDPLSSQLMDPGENPYASLLRIERHQCVAEAMRRVSDSCRKLWLMIFKEKRSYREIAGILDTTEGAIKQSVYRCNQALIEMLKQRGIKGKGV